MPRDASGNYTLPAGNPVTSGTTIQSSWANTTLEDIADGITDSLDRNGRGGMLAALEFADGTVSLPGITWSNELTTGFYRAATGDMRVAALGSEVAAFTSSNIEFSNPVGINDVPSGDAQLQIDNPNAFATDTIRVTNSSLGPSLIRFDVGSLGGYAGYDGTNMLFRNAVGSSGFVASDAGEIRIWSGNSTTASPDLFVDPTHGAVVAGGDTASLGGGLTKFITTVNGGSGVSYSIQTPMAVFDNNGASHNIALASNDAATSGILFSSTSTEFKGRIAYDNSTDSMLFGTNSVATQMSIASNGKVTVTQDLQVDGSFTSTGIDDNASSRALTLDSSGNVGIGASSVDEKLHVEDLSAGSVTALIQNSNLTSLCSSKLQLSTSTNSTRGGYVEAIMESGGSGGGQPSALAFGTNVAFAAATERMRIDSSGNVGIGTSSPSAISGLPTIHLDGSGGSGIRVANGSSNGILDYQGTTFRLRANVGNLTIGTNQSEPLILFTSQNERMRIDSSGNLLVGTDSAFLAAATSETGFSWIDSSKYGVFARDVTNAALFINKTDVGTAASTNYLEFRNKGTATGYISYDGTDVSITQASDARLKNNIKNAESALSIIESSKVRSFDWNKEYKKRKRFGFIAQELYEAFPEAVKIGGDNPEDDPWLINESKLIPVMVRAIQEQQEMIQELRARVAQLENGV